MTRRLIIAAALAAAPACAWTDGSPFAEVDIRLAVAFDGAGREVAGDAGWYRLNTNYQVRIDALELELDALTLLDSGGGAAAFDPANPPPGYSLCHNGHCHHDDGRLVSYDEIIAELAEGGGATAALAVPIGTVDALAGVERALCDPPCALGLADVGLATVTVSALTIEGTVRDAPGGPGRLDGEQPFAIALAEPVTLSGALSLPADRTHDPDVRLDVRLAPGPALLDDSDWAAAEPPAPAAQENLEALPVELTVTR